MMHLLPINVRGVSVQRGDFTGRVRCCHSMHIGSASIYRSITVGGDRYLYRFSGTKQLFIVSQISIGVMATVQRLQGIPINFLHDLTSAKSFIARSQKNHYFAYCPLDTHKPDLFHETNTARVL